MAMCQGGFLVLLVLLVLQVLLVLLILGPLAFSLWARSIAIANLNQQNLRDQKAPSDMLPCICFTCTALAASSGCPCSHLALHSALCTSCCFASSCALSHLSHHPCRVTLTPRASHAHLFVMLTNMPMAVWHAI